ncbi:MAG: leucine-rich repeat domain-containing protein [Bacteroidaceae bacterium]|nr:leucine-rich repeat domain-containing protein [Bacteroidaceae bacterium]
MHTISIFCGLQKLNTLNLRHSHPPLNPCNHFSTVLIKTNWYTISCKYSGCSGLTSITIPNSVRSIGKYAFKYCSGLTSITIPNSVTSIGGGTFHGCSGLTSIDIPNLVTSIESNAFSGCSGLTSITIPNSVTSIGVDAFYDCSGLTSITIPNSVTSIGDGAFEECTGLTSITIPNSVKSIGDWAFFGCSGLTSIFVSWSRPLSIRTYTFENIDKTNCILYVPKGTSTLYKPAPVWEDFQNIQEYEDEEFLANKKAFEEYKNAKKADAENLAKKGDSQAVLTLITNAKSAIDALTYDESLSLDDNKKAVDAIITKLESDVKAQREAEELWANKLAFNTYRNSRKSDADALAKPDDSQEILAIITRAKEEIEGLEYDQSKSLSDNMAAVDAIIRQLKTDLENARIAAGMNGIITSDGNLQIHTLDGRKVDSIVKSGFYIINGVKKYVNGNSK